MSLPYTLVEKSVLRKPNSEKSIGTVLTDTIAWMNSLEEGNSVANFFYYAEVIDSDTKDRYFVYSDEAVAYFGLSDNIVEADNAGSTSNGNTISVSEAPGYSTEEVLTERRWIDGKPIYRKAVKFSASSSSDTVINVGAEQITDMRAIISYANGGHGYHIIMGTYSYATQGKDFYDRMAVNDNNEVVVGLKDSRTYNIEQTAIIEYTKATDTANSPVAQIDIIGNNTISVSETPGYSEDEVLTERRWVDGKPIYRKSYSGVTPSSHSDISDFNYSTDAEYITITDAMVYRDNGWRSPMGEGLDDDWGFQIIPHEGHVNFNAGSGAPSEYFGKPVTFTIEYTKTTDTASSPVAQLSVINDNNSYSTEETLTGGTWIDGKPIYRRVFNLGNLNDGYSRDEWHTITLNENVETTVLANVIRDNMDELVKDYDTSTHQQFSKASASFYQWIVRKNIASDFNNVVVITEYTKN